MFHYPKKDKSKSVDTADRSEVLDIFRKKEDLITKKIEDSFVKIILIDQQTLFRDNKINFGRAFSQFKGDDKKSRQAAKDWMTCLLILEEMVTITEYFNLRTVEEHAVTQKEYDDRMQELVGQLYQINNRFKDLLGIEHIDPFKKFS